MTERSGAEINDLLLLPATARRGQMRGFAGSSARCPEVFSATATSPTRWPHRRQEPQERRRQPLAQMQRDLGYEFCRNVSARTAGRWPVSAPIARWSRTAPRRRAGDTQTALSLGKAVAFRAAEQVTTSCRSAGRHPRLDGPRSPEEGAGRRPLDDIDWSRPMTASRSPS